MTPAATMSELPAPVVARSRLGGASAWLRSGRAKLGVGLTTGIVLLERV